MTATIEFLHGLAAHELVATIKAGDARRARVTAEFGDRVRAELRHDDLDACLGLLGGYRERLRTSCFGVYQGQPFQETIAIQSVPEAVRSGYAVVIEDIRALSPTIESASAELQRALGFGPSATPVAFSLSPPGESVPTHFDGCEVVAVQLEGTKTFEVGRVTEVEYPSRAMFLAERNSGKRDGLRPPETFVPDVLPSADRLRTEVFAPGDAWLMSRGWWHNTATPRDQVCSAGLIFKVRTVTGTSRFLEHAREVLDTDPSMRRPVVGLWSSDPQVRAAAEADAEAAVQRALETLSAEMITGA